MSTTIMLSVLLLILSSFLCNLVCGKAFLSSQSTSTIEPIRTQRPPRDVVPYWRSGRIPALWDDDQIIPRSYSPEVHAFRWDDDEGNRGRKDYPGYWNRNVPRYHHWDDDEKRNSRRVAVRAPYWSRNDGVTYDWDDDSLPPRLPYWTRNDPDTQWDDDEAPTVGFTSTHWRRNPATPWDDDVRDASRFVPYWHRHPRTPLWDDDMSQNDDLTPRSIKRMKRRLRRQERQLERKQNRIEKLQERLAEEQNMFQEQAIPTYWIGRGDTSTHSSPGWDDDVRQKRPSKTINGKFGGFSLGWLNAFRDPAHGADW